MLFESRRQKKREAEIFRLIDSGFDALAKGEFAQALQSADAILAIEDRQVDALYLKGRIAQQEERLDLAQDMYERAILAKPDFIDPYLKLVAILLTSYRSDDALAVGMLALSRAKPGVDQLVELCSLLMGEFPEQAREILTPAMDRDNPKSQLWAAYQQVLHRLRIRGPEYDAHMAEMRSLFPGTVELELAEAMALAHGTKTDQTIEAYQSMSVKYPELRFFIGETARIYRHTGKYDLAEAQARKLVEAFPDNADYSFLLADILLCQGQIAAGLELNEHRFNRDFGFNWKYLPMPNWRGEPLAGKRILVIEEQGFGDCIMFGRYLPELIKRGARIRYVCRPAIYPLFAGQPALRRSEIYMQSDQLKLPNDMDYYVANMSVARCLGIDAANAGDGAVYLSADRERVAQWQPKLPRAGRPLVGIAWAGNLQTSFGYEKSVPSNLVPQILNAPEVDFVSLQLPASLNEPHRDLFAHVPQIIDFNDTMAVIDCLDAVISVDTSVAHLAASMGKRTILLSRLAPDWRWDGPASGKPYWYPEVEVLRQEAPGDWTVPLEKLALLLKEMKAG